jgi:DNA-binding MarR family transcriptional regulator
VTNPPIQELGSDLTLYAARLVRLLRRELPQPVGMRVLSILDESGPLGITQLAAIDQCSQPTMSGTVNVLADRTWVTKRPDPADARGSRVDLTASGRKVLADARRAKGAAIAARLTAAGLGRGELVAAVDVLRTVLETPNPLVEEKQ